MKLLEKAKSKATIALTALIMLPSQVFAKNEAVKNGGFEDTVNTLSPVIDRLRRPLSMALNGGLLVFGIILGVTAFLDFIKSGNEENPNNEKELKKRAARKAVYAAVAILGVTIINIIFTVLEIPWGFNA